MDVRREVREIWKHMSRYQEDIGEAIIYYKFDAVTSVYDHVYDEGYRRYEPGLRIPILWIDQSEATEDYAPEGRRPTLRIRLAVSARDLYEAGMISYEDALRNADSLNELRLMIKLQGKEAKEKDVMSGIGDLTIT